MLGSGSERLSFFVGEKQHLRVQCFVTLWIWSVISSLKIHELMLVLVLLCLMLFIRFRRYKQAMGSLQESFFRDTTRYMIYIISEVTPFVRGGHAEFFNFNQVLTSISIILTVAPPVRYGSHGLMFLFLLLSTGYMGFCPGLVSTTRSHMHTTPSCLAYL
jgi:hypothetical protein